MIVILLTIAAVLLFFVAFYSGFVLLLGPATQSQAASSEKAAQSVSEAKVIEEEEEEENNDELTGNLVTYKEAAAVVEEEPAPVLAETVKEEPIVVVKSVKKDWDDNLIRRITREDVLYYAGTVMPEKLELAASKKGVVIERRQKPPFADVMTVNGRVFALLFDKSRTMKLYVRANQEKAKELVKKYGNKCAEIGGFFGFIIAGVNKKESVYKELEEACAYASQLSQDSKTSEKLSALLEKAAETDAFRSDDTFKAAIKEKREQENLYLEENKGPAAANRAALIKDIDKYATVDDVRTQIDPKKPNLAVVAATLGKPYARLYDYKGRLRVRVLIPYSYAAELLKTHPIVYKAGKNNTWYDVVVDATFSDRAEVFAIVKAAKAHTREILKTLKKGKK